MRILVAADYYRHGAARVVEDRAAALAARGHGVVLLAGTDPARLEAEEEEAAAAGLDPELVPWLPADRGHRAFRRQVGLYRAALAKRWARGPFDAILLNQPFSGRAVLGARFARGTPCLYTFHSPWPVEWAIARGLAIQDGRLASGGLGERLQFAARRWIEGRCLRSASAVTLLSEFMREQLHLLHRVDPAKVRLVPGGVDLECFRPLSPGERGDRKAALGFPPGAPLLLTVRRLVPRMGLENLLRAFRILVEEFRDLRLAIGGAGPLEGELRALAGSLEIAGRVRFLGYVPEGALPGLYAASDLFVLPTALLEGFGLVTIEALACGTPVVGTPVGATPSILRRVDPRLVAADAGPKGLAAAAAGILALPEPERRALGALGRRRAAALFDAHAVGDALEDLLASVAGVRRPSRRPAEPAEPAAVLAAR